MTSILEVEPGLFSVIRDGKVFEARVSGGKIMVNGHPIEVDMTDPRHWKGSSGAAAAHGRSSLHAAMPGKIVRVLVSAGDEVELGQGLIVVEAMKMQNEMKAPRPGRVTSVAVRENDHVTAGAPLIVIE